MPSSLGKHYELNWLKDQGWKTDVDNQNSSAGTYVLGESGLITDAKAKPQRFGFQNLFSEIQPDPASQ